MVYHVLCYLLWSPSVLWAPSQLGFASTFGALPPLFLAYDLVYSLTHRFLHLRGVYGWVHKHHHRQVGPS